MKRLDGPNVKKGKNKQDLAEQVIADIRTFKAEKQTRPARHGVVRQHRGLHDGGRRRTSRLTTFEQRARGERRQRFRRAWCTPTPRIREGIPYANAAPNLTADIPAMRGAGGPDQGAARRQGPEDRPDADQDDHRARAEGPAARRARAGTRRTSSATATARCSTIRSRSRPKKRARSRCSTTSSSRSSIPISTTTSLPRRPHQLLPAAR